MEILSSKVMDSKLHDRYIKDGLWELTGKKYNFSCITKISETGNYFVSLKKN